MSFKNGIEPKEVILRDPNNPIVYFDLKIGTENVGRIVMELFQHTVPVTAENFRALCTGEKGLNEYGLPLHYKGSFFHKLVPYFMYQAGDIVNFNGSSGFSIYGPEFSLENFTVLHDEPGILSMVNIRETYCNSQFIITSTECPHLDGRSVAFGRVIKGFSCVQQMGEVETTNEIPQIPCLIANCGQLNSEHMDYFDTDDELPHGPEDLTINTNYITVETFFEIIEKMTRSGDAYLSQQQFTEANSKFRKVLRYIAWSEKQLNDLSFNESEKFDLINFLKTKQIHANIQLATTTIDPKMCIKYCDQVLEKDEENVIALHLKGKAQLKLKDYDGSLLSQNQALKLSPKDLNIINELSKIREEKAAYLAEEKKVYQKMFRFK